MSAQLAERTVLVTGGGSGLGRAICMHCARSGSRIVVTDKDFDAAKLVASDINQKAGRADPFELDVCREDQVQRVLDLLPDGGRIDVLINNAGFQHVARLEEFPDDTWAALVDVMLNGAARMTRAVLPGMRRRNFGRIINIGSIHSIVASPFKSAYVAAKHGLLGFSKAIALETADVDVTINTICPSYIRTPLVDAQIRQQAAMHAIAEDQVVEQIMLRAMPKKTFVTFEEVAAAVDFLAAPLARNITGQSIVIDGGWTAA